MKEKHVQTEMIFIHHLFVSRHMDNENHRTPSGDGITPLSQHSLAFEPLCSLLSNLYRSAKC